MSAVPGVTSNSNNNNNTPSGVAGPSSSSAQAASAGPTGPVVSAEIREAQARQSVTRIKPWMEAFSRIMPELPADTYSNAEPKKIVTTHLVWDTETPDFASKTLRARATYDYNNLDSSNTQLVLDVKDLLIASITVNGEQAKYQIVKSTDVKPDALKIEIPAGKGPGKVEILYETSPSAEGIFWVDPPFTEGKTLPLVYTLFEPCEGASVVPGQHTPQVRITYEVNAQTGSKDLMALSSVKNNPLSRTDDGKYAGLRMNRAVPLYLLSLHVGNFDYRGYDARTGVYSEDAMIDRTEQAFTDLPKYMKAAEDICGPYNWEKYCPIILCWAFPYGAMEHPCASTCGSTCIEQPSIIPHELAHSWTGNDITNCNWHQYFWNEGWTTFVEYLITEKIWGTDYASARFLYIMNEAVASIAEYRDKKPEPMKLCNKSDEFFFTRVPYAKGALFFFTLREAIGHQDFDRFMKDYMAVFYQNTMSDGRFLAFLKLWLKNEKGIDDFDGFRKEHKIDEWLYGIDIPSNAPKFHSQFMVEMDAEIQKLKRKEPLDHKKISSWDITTRMTFVQQCNGKVSKDELVELDRQFDFTHSDAMSILGEWARMCASYEHFTAETRRMIIDYVIKRNSGNEGNKIVTLLCKSHEGRIIADAIVKEGQGKLFPFTMGIIQKAMS